MILYNNYSTIITRTLQVVMKQDYVFNRNSFCVYHMQAKDVFMNKARNVEKWYIYVITTKTMKFHYRYG